MNSNNLNNQKNISYPLYPVYSQGLNKQLEKKKTEKGKIKFYNSLAAFKEMYPNEESVLHKIFLSRLHKSKNVCPKCDRSVTTTFVKLQNKLAYQCRFCRYTVFPLTETILERTHIPLSIWFELLYHLISSKHGLSGAEVARAYNLKPDTGWKALHRLRFWMLQAMNEFKFHPNEEIEMDEVYITTNYPHGKKFTKLKKGTGSQRQGIVFTITGRDSGITKAYHRYDKSSAVVREILEEAGIMKTNKIKTDESTIYSFLITEGYDHSSCNHSKYKWVGDDKAHTNTLEGMHALMKGPYRTVHRGITKKHLQKYISETVFRFSMRNQNVLDGIDNLLKSLPPLFTNYKK